MPSDSSGSPSPEEILRLYRRRKLPRYLLKLPVEIYEPIRLSRVTAETADISLKGCYVLASKSIEQDFIVQLRIRRKDELLEVWARVVYTTAERGIGLAFLSTQLAQEGLLTRWINEEGAPEKPGW